MHALLLLSAFALPSQSPQGPLTKVPESEVKPAAPPKASQATGRDALLVRSSVKTAYTQPHPGGGPVVSSTQWGSGTVIKTAGDRFWVLACAHTVTADRPGQAELAVVTYDGRRLPGRVLARDPVRDLSLLEVTGAPAGVLATPVAKEADEAYAAGTQVLKVGHPRSGPREVRRGRLLGRTGHSPRDPSVVYALSDAGATSGDSGGGLLRASDLALVGVVWGGRPGTSLVATRVRDVRLFLAAAKFPLD